jgi:MoaD family protein
VIRVKLFAVLREMAGAGELEIEATTVGEVLAQLSERLGPRFDRIMASGSMVVDGERAEPDRHLQPGSEVAVLPPVSGGRVVAWGNTPRPRGFDPTEPGARQDEP